MHELNLSFHEEQNTGTLADRRAAGRALRHKVPRSSHAEWAATADRPDPLSLLEEQNRSRLAHLVPLRYARMAASPFTFLRGSAIVMAQDLAATPVTGIQVQICGDAHLSNFGIYATPERNQVFDVNDFDETLPGPWEWDLKRLAAGIVVAGRTNGFPAITNRRAVLNAIQSYREHMWKYSEMHHIDVWYSRIDYASSLQFVRRTFRWYIDKQREKSRRRSSLQVFPRLAMQVDGQYQIKDDPPLIAHLDDQELAYQLRGLVEAYRPTVQEDRRVLLSKYRCVDLAQKVVGVGSVGTRCYVVLLLGNDSGDPLLLQIKQAQPSVLERHLGPSVYPNHAQRVVCGQRLMQAASDLFLGWTRLDTTDYYIRQLRDMKLSVNLETLIPEGFIEYCRFCGWALARAHARSGDSAQISGYLGRSDVFDRALAAFAETYADQTERDYAALVVAIQSNQAVQGILHEIEEEEKISSP
ncbi:MAG TPA: DUF2252 domain-containing protein [Ktedonobacteraceae bacterium]|nr:DUF2252 domain-containing protein [Ktedonobacteraceae bacterium]